MIKASMMVDTAAFAKLCAKLAESTTVQNWQVVDVTSGSTLCLSTDTPNIGNTLLELWEPSDE